MKKLLGALITSGTVSLVALLAGCVGTDAPVEVAATPKAKPALAAAPTASAEGTGFRVSFAAAAPTDCAVWVVAPDGKTVRHLAAGLLGGDAPAPLAPNSLAQSLLWDGKDDAGNPVADAAKCSFRVGLGLSASYDRTIGLEPQWQGSFRAMAVGPKGELYAYTSRGICVFDSQGKYQKQLVPAPAGMPVSKLAGLAPVKLGDGSDFFTRSHQLPGEMIGSMAISPDGGTLYLPGPGRYARNLTRIGTDGSVPAGAFDTKLTALSDVGLLSLAVSPDGKMLYAAGAEAGYQGDDARKVAYRQVVYRLRLDSVGPAEVFIGDDENAGATGFSVDRPRGLATDPQGRLYVCNNGRGDVAVFTARGGFLKSLPVKHPQQVAVNPKTGQVYVLAGEEKEFSKYGFDYPASMREARVVRLSADGKEEASLVLDPPFIKTRKEGTWAEFRACMAADFSGERPVIWVGLARPDPGFAKWALLRIEDEGDKFSTPRDVCPKPAAETLGGPARHLALDRKRDVIYLNEGTALRRFTGDGKALPNLKFTIDNPDAKEGEKKEVRRHIAEMAVGPDGSIYVLGFREYKYSDNYITRYTPEGEPLPLAVGEAKATHVMKGGSGNSTRGFSVGPDGSIYVLYYDDKRPAEAMPTEPWDRAFLMTAALAKYDPTGKLVEPRLISHLRFGAQCVRADRSGNLYVADNVRPVGAYYPRDMAGVLPDPGKRQYNARLEDGSFDQILRYNGSIFKFGPAGGKMVGLPEDARRTPARRPAGDLWKPVPEMQWLPRSDSVVRLTGALWQYQGASPVPAEYQGVTHVERCVCVGLRFDLDEFDRVFVPDTQRNRVTVLDSAGNVLCRFGSRGNIDTPGAALGLIEPGWVAAAADRVYVADGSGWRILRAKLGYAVEASCPAGK